MIERSTTSIMAVKTVIMIVQIHNGARREEEEGEGGYSEGTGRIQWGYSESTVGYSEDTVRVHWGTVRVQLGYSGIRREEERVRRRRKGGYIEGTGRIQWGYSESTVGYSEYTVRVHWGTVRIQ